MQEESMTEEYFCRKCSAPHMQKMKYCPSCGEIQLTDESSPYISRYLLPVFIYYVLVLALLAVLTYSDQDVLEATITADIGFSGLTIVFALIHISSLKTNLSFKGFNFLLAGLIVAAAFLFAVLVFIFVLLVNEYFNVGSDGIAVYDSLQNYSNPLLLTLLTMALQPALFEEIAFRGFIFNNLLRMATPLQTIVISSFMFGILHLSPISLVWMIPLAVFYAFLRNRYNMIWYGVLAHFVHNSTIVFLELLHNKSITL